MAISDIQLKNNYYQIFDSNGKKGKEMLASNVGQLCGIGTDFSVFLRNNYYATFDEDFKKICISVFTHNPVMLAITSLSKILSPK